MYATAPIQEIPLSSPFFRRKVEAFLQANGLRMEPLDAYYAILDKEDELVAGAGMAGDVLKGLAVRAQARSEGLLIPLVSHILSLRQGRPLKVFTKPEYRSVFESLGFRLLAQAPLAILLENGRGLEEFCAYLRCVASEGRTGAVVMNANPFTLGHQYLLSQALEQVDHLYVIPVGEEGQAFPYAERRAMISAAVTPGQDRVSVLEGSAYAISAATFPTYFLKDLSQAAETQMRLDLDLFARWIAPALGVSVRFVGSEPSDALTARYNALMRELLPAHGIAVVEVPRTEVSATAVRAALDRGYFREASALTPACSHPYLLGYLAHRALLRELDTPLKPGLVCPDSSGAHRDMDYALMRRALTVLRPFWTRMALAGSPEALQRLGIEAEEAMLSATGGVNTHRGAIFALGLLLNAFYAGAQLIDTQSLLSARVHLQVHRIFSKSLGESELRSRRGARRMAEEGYASLFEDWLPFYRSWKSAELSPEQATLLRIMSTLEDTCVIKRVGPERANMVRAEAGGILEQAPGKMKGDLHDLCERYAAEGISPGGAADMLALTIFIDSILK